MDSLGALTLGPDDDYWKKCVYQTEEMLQRSNVGEV